jgi:hypothetical protein
MELPDKYNRILYFDEPTHKYTDNLGNTYTSTTTLIHKFEVPFDKEKWARRLAKEGRGQYSNKGVNEIKKQWEDITEEACNKGSLKHNNLEHNVKRHSKFYNAIKKFKRSDNVLYTIDDIVRLNLSCKLNIDEFIESLGERYPTIVNLIKWYVDNGFELYAEVGVYDPEYLISGMIDLLAVKDNLFVVLDWKTNKDEIKFESGYYKKDSNRQLTNTWVAKNEYLKYPLDNLPNCKGSIYSCQLSTYAKMVEDRGFICGGIVLIQIRDAYVLNEYGMPKTDSRGKYIIIEDEPETVNVIKMPYYRSNIINMFEYHAKTELKDGVQYKLFNNAI